MRRPPSAVGANPAATVVDRIKTITIKNNKNGNDRESARAAAEGRCIRDHRAAETEWLPDRIGGRIVGHHVLRWLRHERDLVRRTLSRARVSPRQGDDGKSLQH